jgi:hypothetical protein
MSQKAFIRINALESRVTALERRLAAFELPEEQGFRAVHRGFGRWYVLNPEGTKMNTEALTQEEAEQLAVELNDTTATLSA